MPASSTEPESPTSVPADELRLAFRDLHGSRLHGFALLLTLGDRALAARLASRALAAGVDHPGDLSHPERAAAWLRRHVLRAAGGSAGVPPAERERSSALEALGVDGVAFSALAALAPRERAAVVASTIERLDRRDVATILDTDGTRLDRLLHRARSRAIAAGATAVSDDPPTDGPIVSQVRAIAARVTA
jgi:hypothetical protein